jgi:hypothetical protein
MYGDMKPLPLWFWCAFPALTMSLGWGLRGSIGGGSLGAMIPGAMVGLALCLLLGREADAGRIAALAAIGVGFGGQETYGQTVGLSLHPETFAWAILGFGIKGAAWGLLGGAFIGAALERERIPWKRLILALALMVLGTWAGWALLNSPKLIYFSNRFDRPRAEVWAGLWLGGLLLLAGLRSRAANLFALYGAIGGGVGFAFGASLQPWGKGIWAEMPLGWWKAMELTFGAILGFAYGLCGWRLRAELAVSGSKPSPAVHPPYAVLLAVPAVALAMGAGELLPVRFSYTIAGAALVLLAWRGEAPAWQIAITATFAAFSWDLAKHMGNQPGPLAWGLVAIASIAMAMVVGLYPGAKSMFLLLTWTAVASSLRYLLGAGKMIPRVTMLIVFVAFAALLTAAAGRFGRPGAASVAPAGR